MSLNAEEASVEGASAKRRAPHPLFKVVAPPEWDNLLRGSGAVAVLGILLTTVVPKATDLAVLFSLALLANGPFSMFLPAAVEPMVMVFARLHSGVLVAGIVTLAAVLAEYVDYRLFAGILLSARLAGARNTRTARFVVWLFRHSPFLAVFLGALTPLPFWLVRISAVLAGYPVSRFLVATALGRFPRFLIYAALGMLLPVGSDVLATVGVGLTVVFAVVIWVRNRRGPREELTWTR